MGRWVWLGLWRLVVFGFEDGKIIWEDFSLFFILVVFFLICPFLIFYFFGGGDGVKMDSSRKY